MVNRLAASLSPYLRQHADNPVDWFEWGPAAFEEARRRDVSILLSAGYAACHWCHVMAHESFENDQVAAVINENVVAIKVDREERPDIDAVHMNVTQALTGQGGWPMTVFLTPEGAPLYAGTYFPREHLVQVVEAIGDIWRDQRGEAEATGQRIVEAMRSMTRADAPATAQIWSDDALAASVVSLRGQFDDARGGFGGAPKSPPSMTVEQLLRHHARTGDPDALAMARRTCETMARGGLYDQLDGGFARYSVDAAWVVPHFEKMLYDNAQLLRVYTHLWCATGDEPTARVVRETAEFLLTRLRTGEGAFAGALDADADGVEGLTYAWTPDQLVEVLGEDDGARAAALLSVTPGGTFEHGTSTLQLRVEPTGDDAAWWQDARARLLEARSRRPQPAREDKVVTAWNGMAISALVEAGMAFGVAEWVDAVEAAARFVLERHVIDGRLRRTSLEGRVSEALAGADDYGAFTEALLVLHQATSVGEHLTQATRLLESARALFIDFAGVHDTGADAEQLFVRPSSSGDNAEPSGASALASAFVMAFALTGEPGYRDDAERCLVQLGGVMASTPCFAGWALAAAEALAAGPVQVAVVEPDDETSNGEASTGEGSEEAEAMWRRAWHSGSPGLVRVRGVSDLPGAALLAARPAVEGRATAYVCRGFVCDAPVTRSADLGV